MNTTSLRSTTAIIVALSMLQPVSAMAQSGSGTIANEARAKQDGQRSDRSANSLTLEEICAQAGILKELECELHILELKAAAENGEINAMSDLDNVEEIEADAQAEKATEALADAEVRDAAEADADTLEEEVAEEEAQAEADAAVQDAAETESEAQVEADAQAREDAEDLTAEEQQSDSDAKPSIMNTADSVTCLAEIVADDGSITCVDTLTGESIEALAAETDAETEEAAEVTTETVTEDTRRSSDEEFLEWSREDADKDEASDQTAATPARSDSGMSDLEKAGLFALGAVVVGALLSNGQRVEANTGDRVVVVDDDNDYRILKDDDALLRQPGSQVRTERFNDGSTRTVITRTDGTEIVTIRDSSGRVLRRIHVDADGRQYLLFDDTRDFEPVVVRDLPRPASDDFDYRAATDRESLRRALLAADRGDIDRSFSLRQVREIHEVRQLAPEINLRNITFATNSAALQPSQAEELRQMGILMRELIADDPTELFLIEGYTDAVGSPGHNLLLSDRRAESVALSLSEYFNVPTENIVIQGYGERFLKISTQQAERLNRRVAVRRITTLVR
ncbi:OmpA family protein [Salinihabitans flavidus]|uniref:OmpA family protein n=2 Tax=Salinihabitans flavidus TaxID=569882 RepID=A0A1H8MBG7_9RHOB|nr:OmpA family protein [Salinihabitans flavidus]